MLERRNEILLSANGEAHRAKGYPFQLSDVKRVSRI